MLGKSNRLGSRVIRGAFLNPTISHNYLCTHFSTSLLVNLLIIRR